MQAVVNYLQHLSIGDDPKIYLSWIRLSNRADLLRHISISAIIMADTITILKNVLRDAGSSLLVYCMEGILEEMERDMMRHQRRMPSTTGADSAYRLEDIR